jgi:hypothetical protein
MSSLWDLEVQSLNHNVSVKRGFELRTVPQMFKKEYYTPHGNGRDSVRAAVLSDTYQSSLQSWLYGATVEISQSGSTPAWSKDTWSFVPLELKDIREAVSAFGMDTKSAPGYSPNVTFETQGLRARLECYVLDYPKDTSLWLEEFDFTNRTIDPAMNQSMWNATNSPPGLNYGYALTGMADRGPRSGYYTCCANETEGTSGDTAIGYWNSQLWIEDPLGVQDPTGAFGGVGGNYGGSEMSMTAKLIVGRTTETLYQPNTLDEFMDPPIYVWIEQPELLMVNCTPVIEHANVSISAELETGVVHNYTILGPLQNATEAWTDKYLIHNTSVDYAEEWEPVHGSRGNMSTYENMTVR